MCHAPKRHGNHTPIMKSYWSNDNEKITRDQRAGSEPIRGEKT